MTEKNVAVSYEIRVAPGAAGNDPEAPDWQVCELENGVIKNDADIYDNLTLAEAEQIVGMWIKNDEDTEAGIIKEIKELPLNQQREILDAISRNLREKMQPRHDRISSASRLRGITKPDVSRSGTQRDESRDGHSSISQRLYGILDFEGGPPTDDEVKDMIADYLLEKYS